MSDYKTEVERTAQLRNAYTTVFNETRKEIKKDDDIWLNRMIDLPDIIKRIKGARKRWATGGSLPYEYKHFDDNNSDWSKRKSIHYNSVNFGNIIPFEPSVVFIKSNKGLTIHLNILGKYVAIVPSHLNIPDATHTQDMWYIDHTYRGTNYYRENTNYLNDMKFNYKDIMVIWANEYGIGSFANITNELNKLQIENWLAIE